MLANRQGGRKYDNAFSKFTFKGSGGCFSVLTQLKHSIWLLNYSFEAFGSIT